MPYPNQHACRLKSPDDFQPPSFRTLTKNQPKGITRIIARPKGTQTSEVQAIRYDNKIWSEEKARSDCEEKGGTFEAASNSASEAAIYPEASWQDELEVELNENMDNLLEQHTHGEHACVCPKCNKEIMVEAGVKCNTQKCPDCGADMIAKEAGERREQTESIEEAATIKAQVQALLKNADILLKTKNLPDNVVANVKAMRTSLTKTWKELVNDGDGGSDGKDSAPVSASAESLKPEEDKEMPPVIEAEDVVIENEFIALIEATKAAGEITKVKVIQPGWGSSGYYSADTLEKAAPSYKEGTLMYWDHPTKTEENDRPERSLRDLAGVLVSAGKWESGGSTGPGIYADAKVFGGYKDVLSELGPHIGVSHRAMGKAKSGEAEGRKGPIIENISAVQSVDFVTSPGAGGKVLQLFEAAKGNIPLPIVEKEGKEDKMSEAEKKELEDLREKVSRFEEGEILRAAGDIVKAQLVESKLPDLTKERLTARLSINPPVKDGILDEAALKTRIEEAVKDETEYLSKIAPSGVITGMGSTRPLEANHAALKARFKESYLSNGMSEDDAERAAEISAKGR